METASDFLLTMLFGIGIGLFCLWGALCVLCIGGWILTPHQRQLPFTEQEKAEIAELHGSGWRDATLWILAFFCWPTLIAMYLEDFWERRFPPLDAEAFQSLEKFALGQPYELSRKVPRNEWPDEIRRLGTRKITVAEQGIFFQFGANSEIEWGLFVLRQGTDFPLETGVNPSFVLLQGAVYRFEING